MDDEGEDDEKDMIADEIFTGDGDGDGEVEDGEAVSTRPPGDDEEEEDDEESGTKDVYSYSASVNANKDSVDKCFNLIFIDIDDFIVDDDGQPITKKKGKKFSGYTDA